MDENYEDYPDPAMKAIVISRAQLDRLIDAYMDHDMDGILTWIEARLEAFDESS